MLLSLLAVSATAAPAYVSDELVLGVYADENNQGQRLATLHSGYSVEILSVSGEFTQVRLADGITGWVKSAFLTTKVPAVVRIKQLQEELDRSRATTPGLAEAAAISEVERLKREMAAQQIQFDAARASVVSPTSVASKATYMAPVVQGRALLFAALGVAIALPCGFWLGYATLARRVRQKFGGIKIY